MCWVYTKETRQDLSICCTPFLEGCLTSDLWTSTATEGYVCLIAHSVDSNRTIQKRILNFCFMPPPHSGIALREKIYTSLSEWGIETKIFSMTLNNASAHNVFVDMLKSQLMLKDSLLSAGDFSQIRCCAHILNLIVQNGLKEIDSFAKKNWRECQICQGITS